LSERVAACEAVEVSLTPNDVVEAKSRSSQDT
jgi:hypothetical protein